MTFRKRLSAILACTLTVCFICISSYAEEKSENVWYGNDVTAEITEGQNGYIFQSVYLSRAYEMSNHMISKGENQKNDIPQLLVLVPAEKSYSWQANGLYSPKEANYEVMYCCDAETPYVDNVHYRRLNLEDSDYYSAEAAGHIRAIAISSYPYITLEEMRTNLKNEGFDQADLLTRSEIISAVQMAIWSFSNNATELRYSQTFDVSTNPQWGKVFHDYTNEMQPIWWKTGSRVFSEDETVAARINALADHLKARSPESASEDQTVITDISIDGAELLQKDGNGYLINLNLSLNSSLTNSEDDAYIEIYLDENHVISQKINAGQKSYSLQMYVSEGQRIRAAVVGVQTLPNGVYFYEPKGGRNVSQCLVGVSMGRTELNAEASINVELPELPPETGDNTVTLLFIGLTSLLCAVIVISRMNIRN